MTRDHNNSSLSWHNKNPPQPLFPSDKAMTGPLSEETNASQHNLRPKEVLFTGIPVVAQSYNAFIFLSSFFALRHKMEKLRNSTQWSFDPQQHDN